MAHFSLVLQDATQHERIDGVESFVGENASGQFGIMAGHTRMLTHLTFGLARYRQAGDTWVYLALPGALLQFMNNEMVLSTTHYLRGTDHQALAQALDTQLRAEQDKKKEIKESLERLEQEMLLGLLKVGYEQAS
ncbi:MAG: F0F1 ATP synthase subunit epsilon [Deltaproteobacteria bacterium]|nr:F0F1 ATP synthase subunit epsilon [Deltaproteobacteria bacterium]